MKKSFPCWVCKGEGTWTEPVTDDGRGPLESCNYCEGHGLIEIGGEVHRRHAAEAIALKILKFRKDVTKDFSWNELIEIGEKALNLV